MIRFILLSVFLSLQGMAIGQTEFAPAGAEWHYRFKGGWVGPGSTHVQYVGDTVLAGYPCKKLLIATLTNTGSFNTDRHFIHQAGDSLFRVSVFDQDVNVYYLFKNKMELGETTSFGYLYSETFLFTVVQVDTLSFNSSSVVRYKLASQLNPQFLFETYIYDRFGPEYGFFSKWLNTPADGNDYYLRCYKDDDFEQVNIMNEPCEDIINTILEKEEMKTVQVFPNPVGDMLNIDWPGETANNCSILLTNAIGKIVLEEKQCSPHKPIGVGHLPPGLYTGILKTDQRYFPIKFVKQ